MNKLAESLLAQFRDHEQTLPGATQVQVSKIRKQALESLKVNGIPTVKHEDWKYTDLRKLHDTDYTAFGGTPSPVTAAGLQREDIPLPEFTPHVAVFLNGAFLPHLSSLDGLSKHATVRSVAELLDQDPSEILDHLSAREATFAALNNALLSDGLYISLPPNTVIEEPIHAIYVNTQSNSQRLNTARLIVKTDLGSRCTVVESHYSCAGAECLTNAMTEIDAGESSAITHYRIQIDDPGSSHVGNIFAEVGKDATVETYSFAFGGAITRVDVNADLVGAGSHAILNGLFMVNDDQHIDHHTRVRHKVGNTTSSENYKGIADGNGRGVFNGKILVEPDAQKIVAEQSSKNLLLSDNAEIDTKPELEIYADDVKCAHGATVGQLDEDAFFYLRSRGVNEQTARSMLTFAFAADIAENVQIEPLRIWLEELIVACAHTTGINELEQHG